MPNGNYILNIFDKKTSELKNAPLSVICNEDYLQNGTNVESCFAHFEVLIPSKSVQLITLT